jgi:serine/threonine protein kinase
LVLENVEGRDLFEEVCARGALDEASAAILIRQLLEALIYVHECVSVIHADVKPENLLITRSVGGLHLKLADFGSAMEIHQARKAKRTVVGSALYMAPEAYSGEYGPSSDMWGVGKVLCFMLFGGHVQDWREEAWQRFTPEVRSFVEGLLDTVKSNRLTAWQAFEHPWLTSATEKVSMNICPTNSDIFTMKELSTPLKTSVVTAVREMLKRLSDRKTDLRILIETCLLSGLV